MGCSIVSVIFLFIGSLAQIIAFSTSSLYTNKIISTDQQGIFQRCFLLSGCVWLTSDLFYRDPAWLKITVVLSVLSASMTIIAVLFSLAGMIPRFRVDCLTVLIGILQTLNAFILAGIIGIYSTFNNKNIRFTGGDFTTTITYSWSYWFLYVAMCASILASFLYCSHRSKKSRQSKLF